MSRISFIVLANSQRAGSTLVQRILNQRPNLFVWGESGDFLPNFGETEKQALLFSADSASLRNSYVPLKSTEAVSPDVLTRMQNLAPDPATIRAATEASLREYGRILYRQPGYDEVGFKVVRASASDVELCCRAWPDVAILLVFREPGAVYRSLPKSWREAYEIRPETFSAKWTAAADCFLEYSRKNNNCHLIEYDSLIAGGQSRSRLLRLADLEYDQIKAVLDLRLNPTLPQEQASDSDIAHVRTMCAATYDHVRQHSELPGEILAHRNSRGS